MLYNQNNIAAEASPVTTFLEMCVGNDLCKMLGYGVPADAPGIPFGQEPLPPFEKIVPWGHITCDGSVANIEALWAARNLKFYGVAIRGREEPLLAPARDIKVRLLNGDDERLIDLDTSTILNLKLDDLVALPYRIEKDYCISLDVVSNVLNATRSRMSAFWISARVPRRIPPTAGRYGAGDLSLFLTQSGNTARPRPKQHS